MYSGFMSFHPYPSSEILIIEAAQTESYEMLQTE